MKLRKWLDEAVPGYTRPWLIGCLLLNLAVFFGTKPFLIGAVTHTPMTPLDEIMPFVPGTVVIYVLAFVSWGIDFILICRESRERCRRVMSAEIIAKLICMVVFILYPTEMPRPEPQGRGLIGLMMRIVYALDTPTNLFPSIHCLENWLCWRGMFGMERIPKWYKAFTLLFALAVFASVLLVHQHLVIDVFGGVAVGEIGLALSALAHKKNRKKEEV